MEIKVKENENIKETTITIECSQYNEEIEKIVDILSHLRQTLICKKDKEIYQIYVQDIYYIEVVDEKTFVYVQNEIYETAYRLYELEILLKECDFVRISKGCLLNLRYLQSGTWTMKSWYWHPSALSFRLP